MNTFKLGAQLLKRNIRSIFIFEMAYRLICIALLLPLLTLAFRLSLWLAGFKYLSEDNIFTFLLMPTTMAILLFLILSISVITVYEVFCIIPAFHASYYQKQISVTQMFQHGFFVLRKSFFKKNISLFLFTMILIPLSNITVLSGYFSSLTIPDFILYYLRSQKTVFRILLVVFVLVLLLSVRYCLSLHLFCLEPGDFRESVKHSKELIHGSYLRTLGAFFGWNAMLLTLLFFFAAICVVLTGAFLRIFHPSAYNNATLLYVVKTILTIFFDGYILFTVPIIFSLLSARYYQQKNKHQKPIPEHLPEGTSLLVFVTKRIFLFLVLGAALLNLFYFKIAIDTNVFWNQSIANQTTITAHRGDTTHAPENSMESFSLAIENHADVIELDVQLSKDDVIVVVHDFNLRRVSGQNLYVWNLTLEQLKEIDLRNGDTSFEEKVTIPTLQEVLETYKGRVKFNIELKPSGHTEGLEKKVVSLLEETDMINQCVVASRSVSCLKKVKFYNEDVKTIYLLPLAYGNYNEMTYADGLSVKSSFITPKLVNHVHNNGKVIYAWTVNNDNDMERMFHLGVDSLVTDKPLKATDIYYSEQLNPLLTTWIKQLTGKFYFR